MTRRYRKARVIELEAINRDLEMQRNELIRERNEAEDLLRAVREDLKREQKANDRLRKRAQQARKVLAGELLGTPFPLKPAARSNHIHITPSKTSVLY